MGVWGKERHLSFRIAAISAVRIGLDKFPDSEAVRSFFRRNQSMNAHIVFLREWENETIGVRNDILSLNVIVVTLTLRVNMSSFLDERGTFHSAFSAAATHHTSRDQRLSPIWLCTHDHGRHCEGSGSGTYRAVFDVL